MVDFNRISVWHDTYFRFKNDPSPNTSVKYKNEDLIIKHINATFNETNVDVVKEDIIDVALMYRSRPRENKVLLLNMADDINPGGCVAAGSGAQEECIFRRSNYYKHLTKNFYPIHDADVVLSKDVVFIKENEAKGNPLMKNSIKMDIMAIPALKFPQMDKTFNKYLNKRDYELMERKVQTMFKLAIRYKYDVVVLSAFGCGAYGNPPREVVDIFKKYIQKYKGYIKHIVFAVLGANYNFFQELKGTYVNN
jgi:uncharacterized protein (TIGR02452 family)